MTPSDRPTTETYPPLTREQVATFLADWQVLSGTVGEYDKHQACTMSAAVALTRVRAGKDMNGATDNLACVDPVLRRLVIARNDVGGIGDAARKEFAIATIPLIVGTNHGKALSVKRAEHIARYAIRVICAEAFDLAKLPESAAKLRSIGDAMPMSDCRAVASEARDTARRERDKRDKRYAAAAGDAAADAADAAAADAAAAAAAAAAYADAAADAAAAGDAAADAAANAAAAADAAADAAAYAANAAAAYAADAAYAYAAYAGTRRDFRLKHLDQMIADSVAIQE